MEFNTDNIKNFLRGKYSPDDYDKIIQYLSNDHLNVRTKRFLQKKWENQEDDQPKSQPSLDSVFYKIYYQIHTNKHHPVKRIPLYTTIGSIAAILIIALILFHPFQSVTNFYSNPIELSSTEGFRSHFSLPDGTTGWLGDHSKLNYYQTRNHERIVQLDGKAYFHVSHQDNHPFVVNTPQKLAVKVLGTMFNVSAYSTDATCEVVLKKGKVRLKNGSGQKINMSPNEKVEYNPKTNHFVKATVKTEDYTGWIEGKLILNDLPLKECCKKLSRFYHVDVQLTNAPSSRQTVRLVLQDESLDQALKLLSMITPIHYHISEPTIKANHTYSKIKVLIKPN